MLMGSYMSICVLMDPYRSLFVYMDSNVFLCVLVSLYESLSILMGSYVSLYFFTRPYGL